MSLSCLSSGDGAFPSSDVVIDSTERVLLGGLVLIPTVASLGANSALVHYATSAQNDRIIGYIGTDAKIFGDWGGEGIAAAAVAIAEGVWTPFIVDVGFKADGTVPPVFPPTGVLGSYQSLYVRTLSSEGTSIRYFPETSASWSKLLWGCAWVSASTYTRGKLCNCGVWKVPANFSMSQRQTLSDQLALFNVDTLTDVFAPYQAWRMGADGTGSLGAPSLTVRGASSFSAVGDPTLTDYAGPGTFAPVPCVSGSGVGLF